MGYSDIALQACGFQVVGIDNDDVIVEKAKSHAIELNSRATFEQADAFDLSCYYGSFDLVYSVGVVEHFDRSVTIQLLQEQAKCEPIVVTLIPTRYIKYSAGLSDERIYTMNELCKLSEEAGLTTIRRFGYGDVISRWHIWLKRTLPFGLYRLLQNRGYAMGIICIGKRPE
jgi:2-polyprenyl-3-methyl-5-hydroxy-6-metoxy-1,4-benzoquinol methylase